MIVLDVVQGSAEWELARVGIPTASNFDRILTPARLQYSKSAEKYRNQILAEWLLGHPIDFGDSQFMERGKEMESQARAWYEFEQDVKVEQVGLVLRDDRMVGGSPDGLVQEDGGLEIKCPSIHVHIGYLLTPEQLAADHGHQAQGGMYLTGRRWWDLVSFSPVLPSVVHRVERDERYIAALAPALDRFIAELNACKRQLADYRAAGVAPPPEDDLAEKLAASIELSNGRPALELL